MSNNDNPDTADEYDRQFRVRRTPRSLLARGSKPVAVQYKDGDGNWRIKVKMSREKFGDAEKGIFLEEFRKWGRMGESAAAAGVATSVVRSHMEKDEDFAIAVLMAEEEYRDKLVSHHQDLVFNGQEKKIYDRQGKLVSTERVYPIRLIELELKKHDEGYRDKREVKMNHTGGVLIAPSETQSIDDWESRFGKAKDITPQGEMIEEALKPDEDDDES